MNRLVDLVFVMDMVLQFFLMYPVKTALREVLEDRHHMIVRNYLRRWFWVDLFTVLPFDVLSLFLEADGVSRLKAVRVIRLLRLLKLVRVLKASRVFRRLEVCMS